MVREVVRIKMKEKKNYRKKIYALLLALLLSTALPALAAKSPLAGEYQGNAAAPETSEGKESGGKSLEQNEPVPPVRESEDSSPKDKAADTPLTEDDRPRDNYPESVVCEGADFLVRL